MRNRVAILALAAVLPLTGAATVTAASQAVADPGSPNVTVKGDVDDCSNGSSPTVVSIKSAQEARKDKSPSVTDAGEFKVTFKKVPTKAQMATATVTCDDGRAYTQTFTLERPEGTNTTLAVDLAPPTR
ncbi:hypothetical protein [Streptomyces cinerochromogenes]|uniref:hypothetical protein n=1 Tax=Streptomyces cinerochromogenes TaxID=66422 RepID=UPI001670879C|nr:hypothetical protein [Streptomyces cinerochromogenes]GGS44465.1 hypothetical protein GCM10010206_02260 [Streptomyces cinerochromogenes]